MPGMETQGDAILNDSPADPSVGGVAPCVPAAGAPNSRLRTACRYLIAPVIAALAFGGVAASFSVPRFEAEARLRVDGRLGGADRGRAEMLASREFMRQVLRDSNLAQRLTQPPESMVQLANLFGTTRMHPQSRAEQALRDVDANLSITSMRDGQVTIGFVADNARLAADVANAFADGYVKLQQATPAFSMNPLLASSTAARIISRAEPALLPLFPNPWAMIGVAAGAGFLLAVFMQWLLWRRRMVDEAPDFYDQLPLPTPRSQGESQHLPWIGHEADSFPVEGEVEPRRGVTRDGELADLSRLVELRAAAARLVVVTGASFDASAAECALALARSLATERRVLLLCLDVAASPLDGLTADPRAPGLSDLLFGVASFAEVIHRDAGSRAHVIPTGRGARDAASLVGAERLALILTALEQTYDHVVIAAPPLGDMEGAVRMAGLGPTLILVTRPGALATDAVQTFDRLASQGFSDIAMVTFTDTATIALPRAA